jgi:predicted O-linked N-acetylglucosamine transferase (SPINDLY family)
METSTIRAQMMGVIEAHSRAAVELYGYSNGPVYGDLQAVFDKFRDTAGLDDEAFVSAVREDEIDVFVEMTGFSAHHRFGAMAKRAAPVQISYLNHAGTCGIPQVDYIFADEIGIPTGSPLEQHYSETIYRIPGCFFVFDYERLGAPPIVDPPSRRTGSVTFGSFGSGGKINLQLIEWWAALLRRVPNSVFYIRNAQLSLPDNKVFMRERFARFGIGPERLRIEGGLPRDALLRCYDDVDISLDTWPYCGGNSVAEALWQGVPVVTLLGDRFAARYGASLVTASGLSDLIAETPEAYIDCAVRLAADADRLLQLRHDLRRLYKAQGLGDSARLTRAFETAYVEMMIGTQSAKTGPLNAATA